MRKEGGKEGGREGGEGKGGSEWQAGEEGKEEVTKKTNLFPFFNSGLVNDRELCDSSYKDRKTSFVSNN